MDPDRDREPAREPPRDSPREPPRDPTREPPRDPPDEPRKDWKDDAIFTCRQCDSRFSSASLLSWHYHQCHTEKPAEPRAEPREGGSQFPCVYCWQQFPSYQALIGHISSAHASAWYHSLATANRLDEYAYMRQLMHGDLRSPHPPHPLPSPLSVTSPLTPPVMTSPLMTSPLITVPDVKPDISNHGNRVLFSNSSSESELNRVSLATPLSTASPEPSTSKDRVIVHHDDSQDFTKININGLEQYLCKFCDSVFPTKSSVEDHVTSSHGPSTSKDRPSGKYECQYCPEAFQLYTALQEHVRCYHGDEYYRRRGRKDSTPPLTQPKRPTPKPSPDDMPMFKCKLCVSGFTENSLLADHYQKVHGVPPSPPAPPPPPVKSPVVPVPPLPAVPVVKVEPKTPVSERSASAERTTPSASASNDAIELKYICEVCDARFPLYVSMQEHIRTAHGERPFECDVCRKQFTKRCYLLKHLQSHPNTHYDCLHCGRRFMSWTQRRDHMMQHEVEGVFLCTHCGSRFTLQRHLEQHLRTHADASHVLVCVDCNQKFEDSLEFQEHVRSHVRCPYCSQVFDTNKNLVDHIEATHQKAKLQARLQQEVKKPQKIVAPVPKTKVQSPAKAIRIERTPETTTSMTTVSTTSVSTITSAPTTSTTTSSSAPFGGGIAPMYVWMPGSHFPAAVFPTLSIVSPQLAAMQALNDSHIQEQQNLQQVLQSQQSLLQSQSNLMGYPAYIPYPYAGNPLLAPGQSRTEDRTADRLTERLTDRLTDRLSDQPPSAHENSKRRRTPESDPNSAKKAKMSKRGSPGVSRDEDRADDPRRYGALIDQLSIPSRNSVSLQCDLKPGTSTANPDQFVCKFCAEILPTPELLARHEAEHNEDSPLNLSTKPKEIKTESEDCKQDLMDTLKRRMDQKPVQISHCEITPVGSDFFRCEICMSIISNLHLVEKHLNEHFMMQPQQDESPVTFSCGKCRVSFQQRSDFFYHLLKNHTDDNYFQCNICKKKFITERFLDKHMNVHLLAQNFTCQFCSKGFYLEDVCNRHERLHWQYGDKPKGLKEVKKPPSGDSDDGAFIDPCGDDTGEPYEEPKYDEPLGALSVAPTPSPALTEGQRQNVYAMYKCQTCQMEFSHKRQIKHHLKDSACALDDKTSSKHYTKFHKCKLCHFLLDDTDKINPHFLVRHQLDVSIVGDAGPRSDNSTSSDSTVASFQEFNVEAEKAYDNAEKKVEAILDRERSPSELKWAQIRGKAFPPQLAEPRDQASVYQFSEEGSTAGPRPRSALVCHSCRGEFDSHRELEEHNCSAHAGQDDEKPDDLE